MRILSKVAAKFEHPADRKVTWEVKSHDLLVLKDAPDWLQKCTLFQWLVMDGSIEVVNITATQKALEADPVRGAKANGKKVEDDVVNDTEMTPESVETVDEDFPKRTRRTRSKTTED